MGYVFQGVGMLFSGDFNQSFQWRADEERECRFVFIGRNLDKKELIDGVMACKVPEVLRFKVGDKVLAKVGGFQPGKIIGVWEDGYPYAIVLDDGSQCYGPLDSDQYVKAQ